MAMYTKKQDYFETPEGKEIQQILIEMDTSESYVTSSSYSPNTDLYASNAMPFVEKHMEYIRKHPNLNATQYISNIKIMSKKR